MSLRFHSVVLFGSLRKRNNKEIRTIQSNDREQARRVGEKPRHLWRPAVPADSRLYLSNYCRAQMARG